MRRSPIALFLAVSFCCPAFVSGAMVDTGQDACYGEAGPMPCPAPGTPFFGQDAQYDGAAPSYKDNGDGTVSDLNTGLMWSKAADATKVSLLEAQEIAKKMRLGGYDDWRVPNIKELYTLIDFRGCTGFSGGSMDAVPDNAVPFINTDYFDFRYGPVEAGERYIDAQWLSSTKYVSTTMDGDKTLFGVNFADGRIKGYGYASTRRARREKKFYVRYVRGPAYGANDFVDNGDGTVTDAATGLMWMKADAGRPMGWEEALAYAEDLRYAGHDDWRLPNAKELQYIVDYTRSPDATGSAAIDPVFETTSIENEAGQKDYPYFWTSTTHQDGPQPGRSAAYVAFGRALGKMHGEIMDVHGAGAQRSDPKTGTPISRGPQGDMLRIRNFVRCVRAGGVVPGKGAPSGDRGAYPYKIRVLSSAAGEREEKSPRRESPGRDAGRFVARLDRDGDGRVSRGEFDGPAGQFDVLDRDRDGYLSEDEVPARPSSGRGGQRRPPA
ncbi:MAG: DUF1566 domain-containing protein [Deltaproteobacteria bacterium]